jgi:hypothetical protein
LSSINPKLELPMCRGIASEPTEISQIATAPAIALAI